MKVVTEKLIRVLPLSPSVMGLSKCAKEVYF